MENLKRSSHNLQLYLTDLIGGHWSIPKTRKV